ncbi:MAG: radical SAM protein [Bacteroidaceae bacterium]|jgi:uncharacterized protein|nr:radical SAM protein [Bacteroidaceae bacterium]
MKKSKYNFFVEQKGYVICYNAFTNTLLCISNNVYHSFTNLDLRLFKSQYERQYQVFKQNGFIIDDDRNEIDEIRLKYKIGSFVQGTRFRLMVYPTQDCNLKCWYCFENHVPGSRMCKAVMDNVVKYASNIVANSVIKSFTLSFFGGEPLLDFINIAYPLSIRVKNICEEKNIRFTTFFITNGTLITKENISIFKEINPVFQVTLDGCRTKHDKVRIQKDRNLPTYDKILESLYLISENLDTEVEDEMVTLRINFDNQTLKDIGNLLLDIDGLDRRKFVVHFERVWQTMQSADEQEQKELLLGAMKAFIGKGFHVNVGNFKTRSYACPAEDYNFAIINYNGLVYKCNGRSLTPETSEGKLLEDGTIEWNQTALSKRLGKTTFENPMCLKCKMLPVCMGPCSQKCIEFEEKDLHRACLLRGLGMSLEEYLKLWAEQLIIANHIRHY